METFKVQINPPSHALAIELFNKKKSTFNGPKERKKIIVSFIHLKFGLLREFQLT